MIYIHPTAATRPATLAALQIATGLRAVTGRRFAQLIPVNKNTSSAKQAQGGAA